MPQLPRRAPWRHHVGRAGLHDGACGGGGNGTATAPAGTAEVSAVEVAPSGDLRSTRIGSGIAAAGRNSQSIQGRNPCDQSDAASAEPITVNYADANLNELEAIGLR